MSAHRTRHAREAFFVCQGLVHALADSDRNILGGVVVVYVQVALAHHADRDVRAARKL